MDADDSVALLNFAFDTEQEDKLFQRWIPMAQNVMSFDDFKRELKPAQFEPVDKTLTDVANILDSMQRSS